MKTPRTTATKTARALRPRATESLAITPITVTDRSSPAVLGLEGHELRELVSARNIRHVRKGHRVIVLVADIVAEIERANAKSDAEPETNVAGNVDGVLALIGRRRTV